MADFDYGERSLPAPTEEPEVYEPVELDETIVSSFGELADAVEDLTILASSQLSREDLIAAFRAVLTDPSTLRSANIPPYPAPANISQVPASSVPKAPVDDTLEFLKDYMDAVSNKETASDLIEKDQEDQDEDDSRNNVNTLVEDPSGSEFGEWLEQLFADQKEAGKERLKEIADTYNLKGLAIWASAVPIHMLLDFLGGFDWTKVMDFFKGVGDWFKKWEMILPLLQKIKENTDRIKTGNAANKSAAADIQNGVRTNDVTNMSSETADLLSLVFDEDNTYSDHFFEGIRENTGIERIKSRFRVGAPSALSTIQKANFARDQVFNIDENGYAYDYKGNPITYVGNYSDDLTHFNIKNEHKDDTIETGQRRAALDAVLEQYEKDINSPLQKEEKMIRDLIIRKFGLEGVVDKDASLKDVLKYVRGHFNELGITDKDEKSLYKLDLWKRGDKLADQKYQKLLNNATGTDKKYLEALYNLSIEASVINKDRDFHDSLISLVAPYSVETTYATSTDFSEMTAYGAVQDENGNWVYDESTVKNGLIGPEYATLPVYDLINAADEQFDMTKTSYLELKDTIKGFIRQTNNRLPQNDPHRITISDDKLDMFLQRFEEYRNRSILMGGDGSSMYGQVVNGSITGTYTPSSTSFYNFMPNPSDGTRQGGAN